MVVLALRVLAEPMVIPARVRLPQVVRTLDACWPSLKLFRLDVGQIQDIFLVCIFAVSMAVPSCAWAWMCSLEISS